MKIFRRARLGSSFTASYKKKSVASMKNKHVT